MTIKYSIVAGQACTAPGDVSQQPLGPALYYYGDLARNRERKALEELPLTHRPIKSPKNPEKNFSKAAIKQENGEPARILTLDGRRKRKQKFGRRRTNTFDGEIPHSRTKIERNGNSDGETDYVDNDFDDFDSGGKDGFDFGIGRNEGKSGEDLPLLGNAGPKPCPVALADRSRAYLCKNLDLEADDVSFTYDEPNVARKSVTYSNAGTFPMPDGKRGGHYDEPEACAQTALEGEGEEWNATGVTRSRSWYLCCPGAGNGAIQNPGGGVVHEEIRRTTPIPVTSAPSPGENQYVRESIHFYSFHSILFLTNDSNIPFIS